MKELVIIPKEVRERAVRLATETQMDGATQWSAILSVGEKIGCTHETLRKWVRRSERQAATDQTSESSKQERIKAPEREVREPREANEILRKASAYFAQTELDRRWK